MYKNYANPFELLDDNHYGIVTKIKEDIDIKKICEFCLIDIIKPPHGGYINLLPKCPFCRTKILRLLIFSLF